MNKHNVDKKFRIKRTDAAHTRLVNAQALNMPVEFEGLGSQAATGDVHAIRIEFYTGETASEA